MKMEENFLSRLKEDRLKQKNNSFCFSLCKYNEIIEKVKNAKQKTNKEPSDYKLIKRFDILEVSGLEKLIVPMKENAEIIYFANDEELFEILNNAHTIIGHGGRDRMMKELRKKYKNITYKDINIFLSVCELCLQKQKREKKSITEKPLLFKDLNSRCQVDLIDFQLHPDNGFKFIMVYKDQITKFVVLKALKSKKVEEVADNLIDIFTLLGAPIVLQSNNGREFVQQIIVYLKLVWPDLGLVHGNPKPGEGIVDRMNKDVENMIVTWMEYNRTSQWSKGLRFIQLMKNKALHSAIKKTPHEALFGQPLKLGLTTSNIPQENLQDVQDEENLELIINSITSTEDTDSSEENEARTMSEVTDDEEFLPIETVNCSHYEEPTKLTMIKEENHLCAEDYNTCSLCDNYFHEACGIKKDLEIYVCAMCDGKEKNIDAYEQPPKKMKKKSNNHHLSKKNNDIPQIQVKSEEIEDVF